MRKKETSREEEYAYYLGLLNEPQEMHLIAAYVKALNHYAPPEKQTYAFWINIWKGLDIDQFSKCSSFKEQSDFVIREIEEHL